MNIFSLEFLGLPVVEWIGYLASVLIALSIAMSSFLKLRVLSLLGASVFTFYGFLIDAWPVVALNAFSALVNLIYLIKMITRKDYFKILEIKPDSLYLKAFLDFHQNKISKEFPGFTYNPEQIDVCYLTLRNMAVAGVIIGHESEPHTLFIDLDFVIPEYRDFKSGRHLFIQNPEYFMKKGYYNLISRPKDEGLRIYLIKMGFEPKIKGDDVLYYKSFK